MPLQLPPQHSAADVHAAPELLQQVLLVPQVSPVQQSAPVAHALVAAEQPHALVAALHTPVQQSAATWHGAALAMQPHLPVELQNGFAPQQSAGLPQLCPAAEQPQVLVAELHRLPQHWPFAVHACPPSMHGVWQSLSEPHVVPLQQSVSSEHGLPSPEQPQVSVTLLQICVQQFAYDPPHGAPSGWHLPHTRLVPVSMQIRPSQQSGPYRMSCPEHGPPTPPQPHLWMAWLHTPSQHGVSGGRSGFGFGVFS